MAEVRTKTEYVYIVRTPGVVGVNIEFSLVGSVDFQVAMRLEDTLFTYYCE